MPNRVVELSEPTKIVEGETVDIADTGVSITFLSGGTIQVGLNPRDFQVVINAEYDPGEE